jgi:hypothetical protein
LRYCRPPDQFSSLLWIDTGKSQKGKGIIRCITIDLEEKIYQATGGDFSSKIKPLWILMNSCLNIFKKILKGKYGDI